MNDVVIVAAKRTPIGSLGGALASYSAPELGAATILELIKSSGTAPSDIQQVVVGNVLSAGIGQAPARQAAIKGGLPKSTVATTVNKVCASGMKAIMMAANQIRLGEADVIIAGGMESMSRVPYYLDGQRFGSTLGHARAEDGIIKDGLWDVYNDFHMGEAAELCAKEYNISREQQDDYAIKSYERASNAFKKGYFEDEIIEMKIKNRNGELQKLRQDEELKRFNKEKIPLLSPVFKRGGTVTAANSSAISDGAAAVLMMSAKKAAELDAEPVARLMGQASFAQQPKRYPTAPAKAIPFALKRSAIAQEDVDLFEINEAFSAVALANKQILNIDAGHLNIHGGAVSMGHPLGCSGARIVVTLIHALQKEKQKIGCAGICNGGGGASSIVLTAPRLSGVAIASEN